MNLLILAAVRRGSADRPEWLARWDDDSGGLLFIHGNAHDGEAIGPAALRVLAERTGLPPEQFAAGPTPPFLAEATPPAARGGEPEGPPVALVPAEVSAEGLRRLESDPAGVWLSRADLFAGSTRDGRPVAALLPRLMGKAGLLDPELFVSKTVFISSTFRDFHAERDHLRDVVLPEVQEECRRRGLRVRVDLVDLRQGVDTLSVARDGERCDADEIDRRKQLLVLQYCLHEIDRSRPFFLALLGDRYGWIAPAARTGEVAAQMGLGLSAGELESTSVTALEIEYGVLRHPEAASRCHFFLREPLPWRQWVADGRASEEAAAVYSDQWLADRSGAAAAVAAGQLGRLKERIREKVPAERVHPYGVGWDSRNSLPDGLDEFGRLVKDCLLADVEAETRELLSRTPPTALEEFVEGRVRTFRGRDDDLARLLAFTRSESADPDLAGKTGVCLRAEPGAGKSAVYARLVQYLRDDRALLVLAHAAGISPGSGSVTEMLRGFVRTLAGILGRPSPLQPDGPDEEADEAFAELVTLAARTRRVVVLVDGLNQFEPTPRARHLTWLPVEWPANARLLATSSDGPAAAAFARRKAFAIVPLRPLDEKEGADVCDAVSQDRYRRQMNPVVRRVLLGRTLPDGSRAAGNALWLELALDALHGLDADDYERFGRERSRPLTAAERGYLAELGLADGTGFATPGELPAEYGHFLLLLETVAGLPVTVAELYQVMLGRIEGLVGKDWTEAFSSLLAVSRGGWREDQLRAMMARATGQDMPAVRFAQLRRGFRAHLAERGPQRQYDFVHGQMREAVLRRYWSGGGSDADARQASLRAGLPFTAAIPEPPALNAASVLRWHAAAAGVLGELPPDDLAGVREAMWHLAGAEDPAPAGRYYVALETLPALEAAARPLVERLAADAESGVAFLRDILSTPALPGSERYRISACVNESLWLVAKHRLPQSTLLELAKAARDTFRSADADVVGEVGGILSHFLALANADVHVGDTLASLGQTGPAAEAFEEARQLLEPVNASTVIETDASVLVVGPDKWDETEKMLRESGIDYRPHWAGRAARQLYSLVLNRLGDLQRQTGVVGDDGTSHFREAIRQTLGDTGKEEELEDREGLESMAVSLERMGDEAVERGDPRAAGELYARRARIGERLAARFPDGDKFRRDLSVAYRKQGTACIAGKRYAEAAGFLDRSAAILRNLLRKEPDQPLFLRDLATVQIGQGQTAGFLGDAAAAERYLQEAIEMRERLSGQDPKDVSLRHDLALAEIHLAQVVAHGERALPHWQRAADLLDTLVAAHAENRVYRTELAAACRGQSASLFTLRRWPDALYPLFRAYNLVEDLHADGKPVNDVAKSLRAQLQTVVAPLQWFGPDMRPADALRDVLQALAQVTAAVETQGRPADDFRLPLIWEALQILERLKGQDLADPSMLISYLQNQLGQVALRMDQAGTARILFERAVASAEDWLRGHEADPQGVARLADGLLNLGKLLLAGPEAAAGRLLLLRASEVWRGLLGHNPADREVAVRLAMIDYLSARPLALKDAADSAVQELLRESHRILSELEEAGYPLGEFQREALSVLRKAAGP